MATFTLSPDDVKNAIPFLHGLLKKKKKARQEVFDKATHQDLSVLFRMLIVAILKAKDRLSWRDRQLIRMRRRTLKPAARSMKAVSETLKSKDKLRVALRPLLTVLEPVINLFVKESA